MHQALVGAFGAGLAFRFAASCALFVGAAGCASENYMGIPLASGLADPSLQSLAKQARSGDKQAQFELGLRFEVGRGVSPDVRRATRLFQMAANDKGGVQMMYLPSATGVLSVPVSAGKYVPGSAEAKLRLKRASSTSIGSQPIAGSSCCQAARVRPSPSAQLPRSSRERKSICLS